MCCADAGRFSRVRIDLDLRQHKAERDRPSGKAARRQRKLVLQGFVGWWECPISRLNNVQRYRADGGGMTGVIPFGISRDICYPAISAVDRTRRLILA